jgi:hypothetical protein
MKVYLDYPESDGTVNRLYPREDFAHGESTASSATVNPLTAEPNETALGAWILYRRARGEGGGVRMKSNINDRNGLYSIENIEVIHA